MIYYVNVYVIIGVTKKIIIIIICYVIVIIICIVEILIKSNYKNMWFFNSLLKGDDYKKIFGGNCLR